MPGGIVEAVNDVIGCARTAKKLNGRIEKPYRYFEPVKGEDSRRYPHIELVETSVQRANANYMGRYIEECINAISKEEIALAKEKCEPVALVIGSNPYRRQVEDHLVEVGLVQPKADDEASAHAQALEILSEDPKSNLGWRIILGEGDERVAKQAVITAAEKGIGLVEVIPVNLRDSMLKEAKEFVAAAETKAEIGDGPNVKVTSFEGCKGMSAQYVFLLGLQSGDMPKHAANVQDIEICRFLVGMTRTKKKCCVLTTGRFGQDFKKPSEFLSWVKAERFEKKKIDASHWK